MHGKLISVALVLLFAVATVVDADTPGVQRKGTSTHTNHWAVIVDTSRFWFNYRHSANALSLYRSVKRLGIPDSNIILMLADDMACNPRNKESGTVFNDRRHSLDLYGDNIEVDYRGYEVTVESFLRLLTGRHDPSVPRSKRLLSDSGSNILVYMTGHGGDEFLKFQDAEEVAAMDIADAFQQMWLKGRYNEIFFMADTCQAATLHKRFYSPNIVSVGSSLRGENSYSYDTDGDLGLSLIDRFTFSNLEKLERLQPDSDVTLAQLFQSYQPSFMQSNPGIRSDLFRRPLDKVLLTDFFSSVVSVQLGAENLDVQPREHPELPETWELGVRSIGSANPDSTKVSLVNQHGSSGNYFAALAFGGLVFVALAL